MKRKQNVKNILCNKGKRIGMRYVRIKDENKTHDQRKKIRIRQRIDEVEIFGVISSARDPIYPKSLIPKIFEEHSQSPTQILSTSPITTVRHPPPPSPSRSPSHSEGQRSTVVARLRNLSEENAFIACLTQPEENRRVRGRIVAVFVVSEENHLHRRPSNSSKLESCLFVLYRRRQPLLCWPLFLPKECIVIMVQWQRHFLPVFRQIAHSATTSSPQGKGLTTLTARTVLLPSISSRSPVYHSFQYQGISGSTCLLSKSSNLEQTPTSSPLALTSFLGSKEAQDQKQTPVKKERVQAVMSKIKQSPKKVNLVAALVRGMLVKDALLQLQVTVKRASRTVYQGITQAQGNAVNNHGLDAERLIVAEAFVGKGLFRKKVSYHSKGRAGIKVKPECKLTVVVREITAEEEAKIARLKVHNFRKLTKREKRLVPHQLIVSNPVWGRKNKSSDQNSSATAA
ncbi:hypothetical protein AHAS_Ahas02G0170500 [Arachis hypogaea]